MEIERQHIMVKRGSRINCINEHGQNILAEIQQDLCCWIEGRDTFEVKQIEVLQERCDED